MSSEGNPRGKQLTEESMHKIDRRKLMVSGAIGAAAATFAAVGLPAAANANLGSATDAGLKDLWRRLIDLELGFGQLANIEDEATFGAQSAYETLTRPWRPFGKHRPEARAIERTEQRIVIESLQVETVALRGGVWHVEEFQSKASRCPWLALHQEGDAVRWQPYSEAQSADQALSLSNASAGKECRSFSGKMAAINRKHGVSKAKAAVEAAHEAERDIRTAIAKAPAAGALTIAVKLAAWIDGQELDADPDGNFDEIDAACVESVYLHAVGACGYDPMAEKRKAMSNFRMSRQSASYQAGKSRRGA
jgi:hypothetical protein